MKLFANPFALKHAAAKPGAGEIKSSKLRPLVSHVGPGSARTTPRRYDRLADEGYAQNVIAFRAITLVAQAAASLPLVLKRGDQGIETHPLLDLIARPNPEKQGVGLLRALVSHYLIAGNAYILAVGPGKGYPPRELWPLRPDTVTVIEGADGEVAGYQQRVAGKTHVFAPDDVWHWRAFHPLSDWYGMAPLEAAALSVDSHNQASKWNLALIQNGGAPSGVLYQEEGSDPLTDLQFNRLRDEVDARHTGAGAAGRPLLLEGGLKWQEMGMSPKDMDWLSGRDMSAREIALAFGVPPQMIGIPGSQTYANYAEARLSLYEDTVIPHVREIISELNAWLVPMFEDSDHAYNRDQKLSLSLDLDDVPALEPKRAAKFDRLTRADFMTTNEKRTALGLAPIAGGDTTDTATTALTLSSGDNVIKSTGRFHVLAPPRFFGPWQEVWAQFGVAGNDDNVKQWLKINFETISDAPSSFDVEISGGDRFVRTSVPGEGFVYVTVTGNVATAIKVRFRSHTLGQNIIVTL